MVSKNKFYRFALICACSALLAPVVYGDTTDEFIYEGRLTSQGAPVAGPVALRVAFYHSDTPGVLPVLTVTDGLESTPLAEGVFQLRLALAAADYAKVFSDVTQPVRVEITDLTHAATAPYPKQKISMIPYAARVPVDGQTIRFDSDGRLVVGPPAAPAANQFLTKDASGNFIWGTPAVANAGTLLQGQAVSAVAPTAGQILQYNGSEWLPATAAAGGSGTSSSLVATIPLTISGSGTLSLTQSTSISDGYLAAADWINFSNKLSKSGGSITGALDMGYSVIHHLGAPSVPTDASTKGYVDTAVGASLSASGSTPLTGNWAVGGKDLTGLGNVGISPTKTLGLGVFDNASEPILVAGLSANDKGKTWFNTSTNKLKYWDGAAAIAASSGTLIASDLPPLSTSMLTSGTLPVTAGGTGVAAFTNNALLVGSGSLPLGTVGVGATYNVLTTAAGGTPVFGQLALNQAAAVSGTLPIGNGGTGLSSVGAANQILGVTNGGAAVEYKTIVGTIGEITLSNSAGTLQLATPQAIATTSSPTFATVNVTGSLGLGNNNPSSLLDISGALTERGLASAPAASGSGQGVIYFDSSTHHFMVSENGGSYQPLASVVSATTVTAGAGLAGGSFSTNGTVSLPTVGAVGSYVKVITDAYGRVVGSTTLVAGDMPALTASAITNGTLGIAQVPNLPAAILTSGTLSLAQVPGLPAAQITSGTLALGLLPNLPAAQITSGTLASATIPSLLASQITSGTLALATIPSLPASAITSGTLALATIPNLPASSINSGTFSVAQIPNLASSYVAVAGSTMSGPLALATNGLTVGTSQLVVAGGNLGLGTTVPAGKLDVFGTICLNGTNCISAWPSPGSVPLPLATLGEPTIDVAFVSHSHLSTVGVTKSPSVDFAVQTVLTAVK